MELLSRMLIRFEIRNASVASLTDGHQKPHLNGNVFPVPPAASRASLLSVKCAEIDDMVAKMSHVFTADTLQRVPCRPPRGRPEPQVWWERGGQRVPTEGRVYQDGLDLVFSPTQGGDSGSYTCVAQNKAGKRTQEVTFTVASKSEPVTSVNELE